MATAGICSNFTVIFRGSDLNSNKTVTLNRACRVIGITANNDASAAGTVTVSKVDGVLVTAITATTAEPPAAGAGVVQAQAVAGPVSNVAIIAANATLAAGNGLRVITSATTITEIQVHCVGTEEDLTVA